MLVKDLVKKYNEGTVIILMYNDSFENRVELKSHLSVPVKTYVVNPKKTETQLNIIV